MKHDAGVRSSIDDGNPQWRTIAHRVVHGHKIAPITPLADTPQPCKEGQLMPEFGQPATSNGSIPQVPTGSPVLILCQMSFEDPSMPTRQKTTEHFMIEPDYL